MANAMIETERPLRNSPTPPDTGIDNCTFGRLSFLVHNELVQKRTQFVVFKSRILSGLVVAYKQYKLLCKCRQQYFYWYLKLFKVDRHFHGMGLLLK